MDEETAIIEEELVYGALRRERLWQRLGLLGMVFGILGCLSAAAVAILDVDPPPVVVPYDPETGFALPEASVGATTITENRALSSNGTENTHKLAYRSSIPAVRGSRSGLSSPRAMISGSVKA